MWITDYRENAGLELWQFQQRVNMYGKKLENPFQGVISERLIHMLEVDENAVTHPRIADAIAVLCGATSEQRDMIVADIHKGQYSPTNEEIMLAKKINQTVFIKGVDYHSTVSKKRKIVNKPKPKLPPTIKINPNQYSMAVVKVDYHGNVVKRYPSMSEAARCEKTHRTCIKARCVRELHKEFGVFMNQKIKVNHEYTFRYADEWDTMDTEQRIADINRTK